MNRFRGLSIFVFAILAIAEAVLFPISGNAQQILQGEFTLSRDVRWENSDLPAGDYVYFVESDHWPAVVRVESKDGGFSGMFIPQMFLRPGKQGSSGIVLGASGSDAYVRALYLQGQAGELSFPPPDAEKEMQLSEQNQGQSPGAGVSSLQEQGYLMIFNPNHEKIPWQAAERVYLRVCQAVEQELNQPIAIRPRLILRLGAEKNVLRYPMREIQLKKWDETRFADAVVEIALRDLVPPEERARLGNSALRDMSQTVNVCDLKACLN